MNIPDDVRGMPRADLLNVQGELLEAARRVQVELLRQEVATDDRPAWARKIRGWVDARRMPRAQVGGKMFAIAFTFLLLMSLPNLLPACSGFARNFGDARRDLRQNGEHR